MQNGNKEGYVVGSLRRLEFFYDDYCLSKIRCFGSGRRSSSSPLRIIDCLGKRFFFLSFL